MDIKTLIKDITGKDCVDFNDLTDTWLAWYKGNVN